MKILTVRVGIVGDTMVITPALSQHYSEADITLLITSFNCSTILSTLKNTL